MKPLSIIFGKISNNIENVSFWVILIISVFYSAYFRGDLKSQAANYSDLDVSGLLIFVSVAAALSSKSKKSSDAIFHLFLSGFCFYFSYSLSTLYPPMNQLPVIMACSFFFMFGSLGVYVFAFISIFKAR